MNSVTLNAFLDELTEMEKTAFLGRTLIGAGLGAVGSKISGGDAWKGALVGAGAGAASKFVPKTFLKDISGGAKKVWQGGKIGETAKGIWPGWKAHMESVVAKKGKSP